MILTPKCLGSGILPILYVGALAFALSEGEVPPAPFGIANNSCHGPGSRNKQCGQSAESYIQPPLKMRNYTRAGEQLFEDLLFHYNKNVRPVRNASQVLMVQFASSLIRIIDLNEKTQQLTTNLWLEIQWNDIKLTWDPAKYDNIRKLNMPADFIWKPDIVLYNNADAEPHITINVDTLVYYDGTVVWKPPAIYKSLCEIDVKLFPYDMQECRLKFGDWSYDGNSVDLEQKPRGVPIGVNPDGFDILYLEQGMDLSYFQESAEWDVLSISSKKHHVIYKSCCGAVKYADVTFYLVLRRKALFYSAFLVVPSIMIALLTTFVFYLPSCSMKKMTLATNILVALMVFFTALVDLVPPNSVVVPLLMKYLLFTMLLVSVSIAVNVLILNFHYRDAGTHHMPTWVRTLLLRKLPKYLCMKIPEWHLIDPRIIEIKKKIRKSVVYSERLCGSFLRRPSPFYLQDSESQDQSSEDISLSEMASQRGMHPEVIDRMMNSVNAMAELFSCIEDEGQTSDDWSYVALVMDRIFLWIFSLCNLAGTVSIFYEAIILYDSASPLLIPASAMKPLGGDTYSWELENATLAMHSSA